MKRILAIILLALALAGCRIPGHHSAKPTKAPTACTNAFPFNNCTRS
jgi:PBP1b-binding outer membrane lipoprotein LpoB